MSSNGMETVQLGDSGLELCRYGCGTGTVGGNHESNQTRMGDDSLVELLAYAYERGIRYFDTADSYGSHPHVARAMAGLPRDNWQLVTKFFCAPDAPDGTVPVEQSLAELATEWIDLFQIHCVIDPRWPEQLRPQMECLAGFKARGLIRAHGVSCHSLEALSSAADEPWVDVIHARINPFGVAMDAPPDQVLPVLERAHANGKGIIAMKIFGQGDLDAEQRAESIRWLAGLDCIDVLLAAFETPAEIDEFISLI